MFCHVSKAVAVLGTLTLTACGGGGGGSSSSGGDTTVTPSYNKLLGQFQDFSDRYELDDPTAYDNLTTSAEMPVRGTATYKGAGAYRPASTPKGEPAPIFGQARMTADFRDGTVSGRVDNLKASPGNRTSGGVIKLEGEISEFAVDAVVAGNLDLNGKTHKFTDRALGAFYGRKAEGLFVGTFGTNRDGEDYTVAISGTDKSR